MPLGSPSPSMTLTRWRPDASIRSSEGEPPARGGAVRSARTVPSPSRRPTIADPSGARPMVNRTVPSTPARSSATAPSSPGASRARTLPSSPTSSKADARTGSGAANGLGRELPAELGERALLRVVERREGRGDPRGVLREQPVHDLAADLGRPHRHGTTVGDQALAGDEPAGAQR